MPASRTSTAAPAATSTAAPIATDTALATATLTPAPATPTATAVQTPTATAADAIQLTYEFRNGDLGWQSGFADYPPGDEGIFEFEAGIRPLPAELMEPATGYVLQSHNRSDDVFMFLARPLGPNDGLRPSTSYQVSFSIVFASNAPTGCAGIGGAPGESVYLKAGATPVEPVPVPDDEGVLRLNVDKGDQSQGGPAASVVGNIANGIDCEAPAMYASLARTHVHPFAVQTDEAGTLWLLVGTDSGYEGLTRLYFQRIEVTLEVASVSRNLHNRGPAPSRGLG